MSEPTYDVVAIGNAIVDVLSSVSHEFLAAEELPAGSMRLIDADRAVDLYAKMQGGREISGGAAANTLAGMQMLGSKTAFIGQVAEDQLGSIYCHDLTSLGVRFDVPARPGNPPTARCPSRRTCGYRATFPTQRRNAPTRRSLRGTACTPS